MKRYRIISGTHKECEEQLDNLAKDNMVVIQSMVAQGVLNVAILISLSPIDRTPKPITA